MFFYNAFMGRLWVGRFKKTLYLSILFCQRKLKYFIVFFQESSTMECKFKANLFFLDNTPNLDQVTQSWSRISHSVAF